MSDTFEAGEFTLERVREHVWEMPMEGDMRVPARVLASEPLLEEIADDRTLEQLRNTTHLPGIRKYAVCMPDGHQGYGFPVGGVAGIDAEDGCISPGAVGYDINCLTGDADVALSFGRRLPISELGDRFETEQAAVAADEGTTSEIQLFTESGEKLVYEIETQTGRTIRATADHPIRTSDGMAKVEALDPGDAIHVRPFQGVEHEDPDEFVVLDESDFEDADPQLITFLNQNGLLPLKSTDDAFNRLLKLVGYHTGDGSFSGEQSWFHADKEDLEQISEDVAALGFAPSRIYERERDHEIDGNEFPQSKYSIKVGAKGFKQLLVKLGAPAGRKVESDFTTPDYLDRVADWQCALYLSAYFGAEMNAPSELHEKGLQCQTVAQNRESGVADAGEQFMLELASYLDQLDIETKGVERFANEPRNGVERLRLSIKNDAQNLLHFLTTVGFRYDREKQRKATKAVQYLRTKARAIKDRERIPEEAVTLTDGGRAAAEVKTPFDTNGSTIDRGVWSGRDGRYRHPADFPEFEEFCETIDVSPDRTVEERIVAIEEAGSEPVYDIGVTHEAHNFVANGFVVSNCGVRMMKTNLTYDDLRGHEEELTEALFEAIPSGLGGGGVVEGDMHTVEAILERGVDWALEEEYAIEDDLAHCEDEGMRADADPSAVSQKAKDRGRNQIGSLGSGNHFLEVQRVTDVFLEDVADAYGLSEDQVVVLIHCGSRGLGHQVCTDYLRNIEQAHAGLLSQLPDKELAAAPAGSQLAEEYYGAMCAAINFAWVNRQLIMHRTRQVFEDIFDRSWEELDMHLLYDVAHNIAKKEVHDLGDEERELYVHRKGATRAFPAGRPEVPSAYRDVGQPIIIPGSMGAGSYVLRGGEASMTETFGSTAHGAGRLMSRTQAKNTYWGEDVRDDLRDQQQIYVKAQSGATIAEEAPGVYKDVDEVVRVSDALGIGDKVARVQPICNIKG